ncbi:hypothetical protein dsx2_3380 [Desulfovibrio sp. X2]|uniref:hypothetical protein n=1 Tax=Desulfovibrio sp. X2 TaxID=941449 RepID=UPI000358B9FF|nr:hypothetical protein [Desulfovibrio sp. X2]EPR40253.1 hypothetical protein dsx2_3380 [Desulfovibrio sp. X2]
MGNSEQNVGPNPGPNGGQAPGQAEGPSSGSAASAAVDQAAEQDAQSRGPKVLKVEAESVPEPGNAMPDLDILEMPVEGVAAFWLSLKKLCDMRRGKKVMSEEAEYTAEPFIRHLLEIGLDPWPEQAVRGAAEAKARTIREGYRGKLGLMRVALRALDSKENPRMALVRMQALFPSVSVDEERALRLAQGLARGLAEGKADRSTLLSVTTRQSPDRLMVKLLFYLMHGRKNGLESLREFLPHCGSRAFREGLTQLLDGFEAGFVLETAERSHTALLVEAKRKMAMSLEMFLGIRGRLTYDQLYTLAKSYIP